ncbi:MAG: alpha/beta fold hydrolase [Caldilineaceae bacterium]|nr:alpha/beta fold hydrolase [Caldilineaceae bacterium]
MNKRQAQLQKFLEELLPEHLDALLKESLQSLDSAVDSAKDSAKDISHRINREQANLNRVRLAAMGRDALDSLDRDKLEKWVRETVRSLDAEKMEHWARTSLRSVDADKLKRLLRDKLGGLDKEKLDELLKEGMRHIDRRKLETRLRDRIRALDLDKIRSAAHSGMGDLDPEKIEGFVRERVDEAVNSRLGALSVEDLQNLLQEKRSALRKEVRSRRGKAAKRQKALSENDTSVVVEAKVKKSSNPIAAFVGTTTRLTLLSAAGWIAYSHLFLEHQVPLPKAIAAELLTLAFRAAGPITSYHDRGGSGRPLVLIHSINAAASSYEMRPLFQHYRGQRPVYALDFPGFGFSARPNTEYKPDTFVEAIVTLLTNIEGGPADVVALSLGSEFAAEAARRRPDLFHSLAVLSPTGMYDRSSARSSQAAGNEGIDKWLYPLLSMRLWARPFYDLLTIRRSLTYFLQRSFVGAVPDGMVDYAYSTSHQPGAEHAPLYFVSGKLFTPDAVDRIYRHVTTPSLVIYDQDGFVSFDRLPELVAANSAWQSARVSPTMGMPHWEKLEETTAALDKFWQSVPVPT